jgi:hypothetical protein
MDITQELAKKLGISETMAAEQLQRNPSLASIITGQTPPRAMAANAPAADLDEEAQATQGGFSTLRELINKNEPGLSPLAKSVEAYPNLPAEKRNQLLSKQYTLEEMTRPEKPSPSSLLDQFKQATQAKETPSAGQSEATIFSPKIDVAAPILTAKAKPGKGPATSGEAAGTPPPPPPPTPPAYETEMSRLRGERETAKGERQTEMDRLAKGELASLIGRSLTQIGAAATGMQKGIDMSDVAQKELVDWDKKREQIYSNYAQTIKELDTQQAGLVRQAERTEDKAERAAARQAAGALERDKIKAQNSRAIAEAQLRQGLGVIKAQASNDAGAKKAAEAEAKNMLSDYKGKEGQLGDLEGLLNKYNSASGKDKTKASLDIEETAGKILGSQAIPKGTGWFSSNTTDREQLLKDVQIKRAEIKEGIDYQNRIISGLRQGGLSANAPAAPQAAAPTVSQSEELARKEARRQELQRKAQGQ